MLTLPLQGLAASLSLMLCHTQDEAAAASTAASGHGAHHHHDSGPLPAAPDGAQDYAGHLCCQIVFTAMPAFASVTGASEPSTYLYPASVTPPLFVPERLQRPPRT